MKKKQKRLAILIALLSMNSSSIIADIDNYWDNMVENNIRTYRKSRGDKHTLRFGIGPEGYYGGEKKIKWFDAKASMDTDGNNCGGLDFGAQFKAMFNKEALNEYLGQLENLVSGIVAAAPMLILQTVDPQLAEVLKHLKAMANINMTTKVGQCKDLYKAVSNVGRQMYQKGKAKCYNERVSNGDDMETAMKECWDEKRLPEFFGKQYSPSSEGPIDITEKAIDTFGGGMSDGGKDVFRALMGSTTIDASAGVAYKKFKDKYRGKREEYAKDYAEAFQTIIESVQSGEEVDDADLKSVISGVSYDQEIFLTLGQIPTTKKKYFIEQLSLAYADEKLAYEESKDLDEAKGLLYTVQQDPGVKQAVEDQTLSGPFAAAGAGGAGSGIAEVDAKEEEQAETEKKYEATTKTRKSLADILSDIDKESKQRVQRQLILEVKNSDYVKNMPPRFGGMIDAKTEMKIINGEYAGNDGQPLGFGG